MRVVHGDELGPRFGVAAVVERVAEREHAPADAVAGLETVTRKPSCWSRRAQASPASPAPTTTTCFRFARRPRGRGRRGAEELATREAQLREAFVRRQREELDELVGERDLVEDLAGGLVLRPERRHLLGLDLEHALAAHPPVVDPLPDL